MKKPNKKIIKLDTAIPLELALNEAKEAYKKKAKEKSGILSEEKKAELDKLIADALDHKAGLKNNMEYVAQDVLEREERLKDK